MTDPAPADPTARSLRRLSIAVWVLAIILALNLVVSILALVSPAFLSKRIMEIVPDMSSAERSSAMDYNSFHDWPIEKQIESSSIIALAKWEKSESAWKCIITEILKQKPNTKFYYRVGDEYRLGSRPVRDDTDYGDGQILFFTGSPASFRFSTSFKGDRLVGLGEMPISELRELIRKSGQ